MKPDEAVQVNVVTFPAGDWWTTPEGEAALDAAEIRAREIAAEARSLAIRRRTNQVDGTLPDSL